MSFTYSQVEAQVSNLLGNVIGPTMADAETNFTSVASTSNRSNPDFPPTAVADAIVNAVTDIALMIAETPRHAERQNLQGVTGSLANRAVVPALDSNSDQFIGLKGRVYDASNSRTCLPMPLAKVRSFNQYSSTIYAPLSVYWYAYSGDNIEHTRTNVIIQGCVWERPTYVAANNVPLADIHESAIVAGAILRLAPREGVYQALIADSKAIWDDHLMRQRATGAQPAQTEAEAAPSNI